MSNGAADISATERRSAHLRRVWRYCVCDGVPRRSFYVAVVVGTVLNIINQPEAIFGSAEIDWTKLALTFVVPYCVATYGAVSLCLGRAAAHRVSDDLAEQDERPL